MSRTKSVGTCVYCQRSFSKSGMTRHLASCQARLSARQQAAAPGHTWRLGRVFHLRVEGKRHPEYWMHIEMPADAHLDELDQFLRDIWVECCGHLSAFTIDGAMYNSLMDDDDDFLSSIGPGGLDVFAFDEDDEDGEDDSDFFDEDDEDGFEDEFEDDQDDEFDDVDIFNFQTKRQAIMAEDDSAKILDDIGGLMGMLGADDSAISQFKDEMNVLAQKHAGSEAIPGNAQAMMEEMLGAFSRATGISPDMLRAVSQISQASPLGLWDDDDLDMDVPLSDVLRPGQTFSYDYDFGTTTELTLRVIEDYTCQIEQDLSVRLLARNEPPVITCGVCGKAQAALICTECGSYRSASWMCATCAANHSHDTEFMLPVVNSPRVGECGYDGQSAYEGEIDDEIDDEIDGAPGGGGR